MSEVEGPTSSTTPDKGASTAVEPRDSQIATLKAEIDAIQLRLMAGDKPWYRKVPVIISITALLFSFGTTAVSWVRIAKEDQREARRELRGLIQRLSALPRENQELTLKYRNDPLTAGTFSTLLNQENIILAQQANELVWRIPDLVGAKEYLAVYNALSTSGVPEPALLEGAVRMARTPIELVDALRAKAAYLYMAGSKEQARDHFARALRVFDPHPDYARPVVLMTNAWTQMYWAQSELAVGECQEAREHLAEANRHLAALPESPLKTQTSGQLGQTRSLIASSCR